MYNEPVSGVMTINAALSDGPGGKGPVGRTKLYELIRNGSIETVTVGRSRFVRVPSWRKLFETGEVA